jgi:hypothetical protein
MATDAEEVVQLPAKVPVTSGGKVAAFVPTTMEEAWRLSSALAASGMTPKSYASDQNRIMVGIMAGAEVGLTPFAALQSIAVIGNSPSLWGDGALALIQASGLLEDMEESDDGHTATCRLNRVGRSTPIVRSFSMDDAKKAGLAGKSGPWSQYPARMRQMRARAFAMRDGFADVLKGLHIAEEVRDYSGITGEAMATAEPLTADMLTDQSQPLEAEVVAEADAVDVGVAWGGAEPEPEAPAAADGKPTTLFERMAAATNGKPAPVADDDRILLFRERIEAAENGDVIETIAGDWVKVASEYPASTCDEIDGLIAAKREGFVGE